MQFRAVLSTYCRRCIAGRPSSGDNAHAVHSAHKRFSPGKTRPLNCFGQALMAARATLCLVLHVHPVYLQCWDWRLFQTAAQLQRLRQPSDCQPAGHLVTCPQRWPRHSYPSMRIGNHPVRKVRQATMWTVQRRKKTIRSLKRIRPAPIHCTERDLDSRGDDSSRMTFSCRQSACHMSNVVST